jgi:hypothetical protein
MNRIITAGSQRKDGLQKPEIATGPRMKSEHEWSIMCYPIQVNLRNRIAIGYQLHFDLSPWSDFAPTAVDSIRSGFESRCAD